MPITPVENHMQVVSNLLSRIRELEQENAELRSLLDADEEVLRLSELCEFVDQEHDWDNSSAFVPMVESIVDH